MGAPEELVAEATPPEAEAKRAEEAEGEEGEEEEGTQTADGANKKKKNRKKKKKAAGGGGGAASEWSTEIRGIKPWGAFTPASEGAPVQTFPPTVPVADLYPSGEFPRGEEVAYTHKDWNSAAHATTAEEVRERERIFSINYNEIRRAAEVHRQVRATSSQSAPRRRFARARARAPCSAPIARSGPARAPTPRRAGAQIRADDRATRHLDDRAVREARGHESTPRPREWSLSGHCIPDGLFA